MVFLIAAGSLRAQSSGGFTEKGATEFGGSISFQSTTSVSSGVSRDAITALRIEPYIGYFITDGFELGFNPIGTDLHHVCSVV